MTAIFFNALLMAALNSTSGVECPCIYNSLELGEIKQITSEEEFIKNCRTDFRRDVNGTYYSDHNKSGLILIKTNTNDKKFNPIVEIIYFPEDMLSLNENNSIHVDTRLSKFLFRPSSELKKEFGVPLDENVYKWKSRSYKTVEYCFASRCDDGRFFRFFIDGETVVGLSILVSE